MEVEKAKQGRMEEAYMCIVLCWNSECSQESSSERSYSDQQEVFEHLC